MTYNGTFTFKRDFWFISTLPMSVYLIIRSYNFEWGDTMTNYELLAMAFSYITLFILEKYLEWRTVIVVRVEPKNPKTNQQ